MIPNDLIELRKLYMGFTASRVILTANQLELFERLKVWIPAEKLARRLKLDGRATEILLDALAGLGVIKKSKAGTYRNTPMATRYLVRGSREYQGDILRHAATMWENWTALDDVVKRGRPARRARDLYFI